MTPYERVCLVRDKSRYTALDFIGGIFTGFTEMRGDRRYADDRAVLTGLAWLGGRCVSIIGIEKGKDIKERGERNFGSAHPEGYRKALRQARLAEKFGRPVICFVDTPGAFCGIGAEERGQGQAISESISAMMGLSTPVISVLIGEGGSGGALALAVADEVWMLERAVYSVISPEGCASILWHDSSRVREASECLKLTAPDLLNFGIIDRIIPEGAGLFTLLRGELTAALERYSAVSTGELTERRYMRYRAMGSAVGIE